MLSLNEFDKLSEKQKLHYLLEITTQTVSLSIRVIDGLQVKINDLNTENKRLKSVNKPGLSNDIKSH